MYCRYCGKQIDDNSIFCEHCGKSQGINNNSVSNNSTSNKFVGTIVCCFVYLLWFWINLNLFEKGSKARFIEIQNNLFYPFTNETTELYYTDYSPRYFNENFYGMPEFLVYVFVLPLVIFFTYRYRKQIISYSKNLISKMRNR